MRAPGPRFRATAIAVATLALLTGTLSSKGLTVQARAGKSPSFDERLSVRVPVFDSDHQPLVTALLRIVYEHHLPLGLEYVDGDGARRPLEVKLQNKSVREVLEALVARLPEYRIAFAPGVIEVYSPKARESGTNLFNTLIENFDAENQTTRMASALLYEALAEKIHPGVPSFGNVLDSPSAPTMSLHLRSRRVYEILDAIAGRDGGTLWAVAVPPDKLPVLRPELWKLYELNFPNWEVMARSDLLGLFPPGARSSR